jgi:hypothetical protein
MSTVEKLGMAVIGVGMLEVAVSNRSSTAKVLSAATRFTTGTLSTAMGTSSGAVS